MNDENPSDICVFGWKYQLKERKKASYYLQRIKKRVYQRTFYSLYIHTPLRICKSEFFFFSYNNVVKLENLGYLTFFASTINNILLSKCCHGIQVRPFAVFSKKTSIFAFSKHYWD